MTGRGVGFPWREASCLLQGYVQMAGMSKPVPICEDTCKRKKTEQVASGKGHSEGCTDPKCDAHCEDATNEHAHCPPPRLGAAQ